MLNSLFLADKREKGYNKPYLVFLFFEMYRISSCMCLMP